MRRRFKRTTLYTLACVGVLLGLGLARRVPGLPMYVMLGLGITTLVLFRWQNVVTAAFIIMCGVSIGLFRGAQYMQVSAAYNNLLQKQVVMQVTAETDAVYSESGQLEFDVTGITFEQPVAQSLPGKIRVEGRGVPMVYRGDKLRISGSLNRTRGANQARMRYANITLQHRGGNVIDTLRRKFTAGLQSAVTEPHASFGAGLLIGQRANIPEITNEQLSVTGLTHIVAVSGANLTIIITAVRKLLDRGSKFQTAIGSVALLVVFLTMTGMSASIVRAALVSGLSLAAWYYGRIFKPLLLMSLAAVITALWNPFYVWSDLAWYLSFLSFFGVLVIGPLVTQIRSRQKEPGLIGGLLIETTAAQIITLPLIMYIFGRVSNIGLLANILIVPLVPVAMLMTLLAGLAGMLVAPIAGWLAWPARIILVYMLDMAAVLSRVPHASMEQFVNVWSMIGLYAAIAMGTVLLWLKVRRQTSQKVAQDAIITE